MPIRGDGQVILMGMNGTNGIMGRDKGASLGIAVFGIHGDGGCGMNDVVRA